MWRSVNKVTECFHELFRSSCEVAPFQARQQVHVQNNTLESTGNVCEELGVELFETSCRSSSSSLRTLVLWFSPFCFRAVRFNLHLWLFFLTGKSQPENDVTGVLVAIWRLAAASVDRCLVPKAQSHYWRIRLWIPSVAPFCFVWRGLKINFSGDFWAWFLSRDAGGHRLIAQCDVV